MVDWIKKLWYIYAMEYFSAIKKKGNVAVCDNMDGLWDHYAKWNKSARERQILLYHW